MRIITTAAVVIAGAVAAPRAALADDVIVVPFGGELEGDLEPLGDELATATVEVLTLAPNTAAQVAQAPRDDILTLAGCPDGHRICIGQLAATLDVDRAATGVAIVGPDWVDIELRVIHRDGVVVTHAVRVDSHDRALVVSRYKTALAQKLGVARPTPAVDVPDGRFKAVEPVETPETEILEPGPRPPAMTPAPVDGRVDARGDRRSRLSQIGTGTWAMFGVGAIGVGLGTAFLIKAGRTEDEIRSAPSQTAADIRALRDLEDRGDSEKTTGAAMMVIGLAATAAGGVMVARDLMRGDGDGVAIAPAGRGDGAAVSWRGSF